MNAKALQALKVAAAVAVPGGLVLLGLFAQRRARSFFAKMSVTNTGLPNNPPPQVWPHLVRLALAYRHVRDIADYTSAYRSPEVHVAVYEAKGKAPKLSSKHPRGKALDLVPRPGVSMDQVERRAEELQARGVFTYVLNEGNHVHVEIA